MTQARLFETGPLRLLPPQLREPRRAWLAILIGWALSFGGSLLLSFGADSIVPDLPKPAFAMDGVIVFLALTIFAPFAETLIMALVLTLLSKVMSPTAAVLVSAIGWGIAHSLQAAVWGLVIWWPFLIFSALYMVWRQRSAWAGIGVAATTHMLQNLLPALMVAKLV